MLTHTDHVHVKLTLIMYTLNSHWSCTC